MNQCVQTLLQAWAPGGCVLELGSTSCTGCVAGRALGLVNLFAAAQGAVGITNLYGAYFLQAHGLGHFGIRCTGAGGFGRCHELHQADDDEYGDDEREEDGKQQMLGIFDGAGMGFFVVLLAHEVL